MSALTIDTVATGTDEDSAVLSCAGHVVGLSFSSDRDVTLTVQVSKDQTTWYDFAMAIGAGPSPEALVIPNGTFATVIDASAFQYIRFNVANASGSDAAIVIDVTLRKVHS